MTTTDQIKFIVGRLAEPPFNKTYNLISFDSLEMFTLLQTLSDVVLAIEDKAVIDIREEGADETAIRLFSSLRILKYKFPTEAAELSRLRAGLVQGDKPVIYPILEWILQRVDDLKKRAYLARYLMKVPIPQDMLVDVGVADTFGQYEGMQENFKELHKDLETLKSSGFSVSEIKKDISAMEEEKEQILRRIDRLKKKAEGIPGTNNLMSITQSLRRETEKEEKISKQKQEQKTVIVHANQKLQRLQAQMKEARAASAGASAESLVRKLEEENRANNFLVKDKLPKEIEAKKQFVQTLDKVVSEPAMGQSDLDSLNDKCRVLSSEINGLVENRMRSVQAPEEDKLTIFRQQASIILRKKDAAAENLNDTRAEIAALEKELKEKNDLVKAGSEDGEVLRGEEFKRYVNKLRSKSNVYKKKKSDLADLKSEFGVLSRTEEILRQRAADLKMSLANIEKEKGVSGFTDTQEELERVSALKGDLDIKKAASLEEMSKMVTKLKDSLNEKRTTLAPLISELRPRRIRARDLTQEYDEKKNAYETKLAGLESNMSKLDQEVRTLKEEASAEESRYHFLQGTTKILQAQRQKVQDELKVYTTTSTGGEKKKSQREQLQKRIAEAEKAGKELREQQKQIREQHGSGLNQMKMWQDLLAVMEAKLKTFDQTKKIMLSTNAALGAEDGVTAGNEAQFPGGADMLVLEN